MPSGLRVGSVLGFALRFGGTRATVGCLGFTGCPTAVFRRIVAVIVSPIDRVSGVGPVTY